MRRFLLDTGIAAFHLDRTRGVFERAAVEVASGNRVGIAAPVLAELAFRAEGSPQRDRNILRLRQALDVWKLWLVDTAAAFQYGRLAFELKSPALDASMIFQRRSVSSPLCRSFAIQRPPSDDQAWRTSPLS